MHSCEDRVNGLDHACAPTTRTSEIKRIYKDINQQRDAVWQVARLFLQQARVAGNALPLAEIENPCIREAANVVIGLTLIGTLCVIHASDNGGISEEIHSYFLNCCQTWFEAWVFDIRQKLLLVADFSVPLGVNEPARHQRVKSSRITVDLGLIPQAFKNHELGLARVGLLSRHQD